VIGDVAGAMGNAIEWLVTAIGDVIAWTVNAILDAPNWVWNAVIDFPDWSVEALEWVVDALEALSAEAWVLLALGLGLLWYVWLSIRNAAVLGPIKVSELKADEGTKTPGLSALLIEELTGKGLLPAAVPAASSGSVVAAVAASPVPQAGWLSKLIELAETRLPRPRSYEISGTLRSRESTSDPCGVTYTLTAPGRAPDVGTVWAKTHADALTKLAGWIYMKVTVADATVFPPWARWWERAAFKDYVDGIEHEPGELKDAPDTRTAIRAAIRKFRRARLRQPENWLPAMRAADLQQELAAIVSDADRRTHEVRALKRYLAVVRGVETLAEARYRASVLLASLKPDGPYTPAVRATLLSLLNREAASDLAIWMQAQREALSQSRKTRNVLRWWGVLLRARRLRSRFEPRGRARRQFLKAVKVSHRCIRKRMDRRWPWDGLAVWCAFPGRWNLAGWQAHYNAACYYALVENHKRAFRHLDRAIGDPGTGVTCFWLVRDPDLQHLHGTPSWRAVLNRLEP
jgi:hypothetical protein